MFAAELSYGWRSKNIEMLLENVVTFYHTVS